MTKKLASNTDLYEYLSALGNLLADRNSQQLAEAVRFAAKQRTGLSTEFLGESRIALRTVRDAEKGLLRPQERDELLSVISQIEFVLHR
jgi:hypothetical protein